MLVIPAIDLKDGRCVRLVEGREEAASVYDLDPVEVAGAYEAAGARLIHIVDLDGAFPQKTSNNRKVIADIVSRIDVPVEVGGGVRSVEDVATLVDDLGVFYAIVGTMVIERPDLLQQAIDKFGDRIVVGIDARGDEVRTRGWTQETGVSASGLAGQVAAMGARRIIYTDIGRDGKLKGPNLEATRAIAHASGIPVTASGGISSLADILDVSRLELDGVDSVIIGKALYEGRFTLEQALEAASIASAQD